jgi:hypothetical protein
MIEKIATFEKIAAMLEADIEKAVTEKLAIRLPGMGAASNLLETIGGAENLFANILKHKPALAIEANPLTRAAATGTVGAQHSAASGYNAAVEKFMKDQASHSKGLFDAARPVGRFSEVTGMATSLMDTSVGALSQSLRPFNPKLVDGYVDRAFTAPARGLQKLTKNKERLLERPEFDLYNRRPNA